MNPGSSPSDVRDVLALGLAAVIPGARVVTRALVVGPRRLRIAILPSPKPRPPTAHYDANAEREHAWDHAFVVEVDGVQWCYPASGGLGQLAAAIVATHAVVGRRGFFGLRPGRRWWPTRRGLQPMLEPIAPCYGAHEPWGFTARPPLRVQPITGRSFLIGRWVMLADLDETWIGAHGIGSRATPIMRVRPRDVPASAEVADALFRIPVSDQAGRPLGFHPPIPVGGVCRGCGRSYDWREGNASDATCFKCAEARGVVF